MINSIEQEKKILESIFTQITEGKSFKFNAGAGSGKTYALVECLKHLQKTKASILDSNRQKIICITYTNVAVNEIRSRLGNSETILVSTIHEMLWNIIQRHQIELLEVHLQNLKTKLSSVCHELNHDPDNKLGIFNKLSSDERETYISFVLESRNTYYQSRNAKASGFRSAYISFYDKYGESYVKKWQSNYTTFKEVAKKIYIKERFEKAIRNIESKEKGFTSVSYDNVFNSDQLHKMKFSHDTLLEYSELLFKNYPMLRRLVIDKYPYIFIDEYQDANPLVIETIKYLDEYSRENNKSWLVGYFGDSAQTIYDTGIGSGIDKIHKNLNNLYKPYNRRSQKQIIDIANLIRNDSITQKPIFENNTNGKVKFYHYPNATDETIKTRIAKDFISKLQKSLDSNSKLDCLVLTNKIMSEMIGFGDIYKSFQMADNIYFEDLNTKLLSHELEKLDPTILIIFKLLNFYLSINDEKSTFYDILGEKGRNVSFKEAHFF